VVFERFAPAKVNLFLHVGSRKPDGYHPICSLMVFADVGDTVALHKDGLAGLTVDGPFAADLVDETGNLVLRARDALLSVAGSAQVDFGLRLHKALPIAAGLGGGSSDAAAAMHLVRTALDADIPERVWNAIALDLGADVPACLSGVAAIATGRGERLASAPYFPDLDAVLTHPGVPSPTAEVYRAYDQAVAAAGAMAPIWPDRLTTPAEVAAFLTACRNDLEPPARHLQPAIGELLDALTGQPETLLARMSGSGATCFSLCADAAAAAALASRLARARPGWWVRPCKLAGASNAANARGQTGP
jgi:4-diphosphocytidyl-2-C-methyl-D-erythritol kinase